MAEEEMLSGLDSITNLVSTPCPVAKSGVDVPRVQGGGVRHAVVIHRGHGDRVAETVVLIQRGSLKTTCRRRFAGVCHRPSLLPVVDRKAAQVARREVEGVTANLRQPNRRR